MVGYNVGQIEIQEEKKQFFLSKIPIVSFEYSAVTGITEMSGYAAEVIGMEPNVLDIRDESSINSSGTEAGKIVKMVRETTPEDEIELLFNNASISEDGTYFGVERSSVSGWWWRAVKI